MRYCSRRSWSGSTPRRWIVAMVLLAGAYAGCKVTDEGELPPDVQDPKVTQTPAGAIARYRGTLATLGPLLDSLIVTTGILTDEMASLPAPVGVTRSPFTDMDSRQSLDGFQFAYAALHRLRGEAREARGGLLIYAPDRSTALAAHLQAVEGYAELLLADLFCSGIPLSRVDFGGDYTLEPGSTTEDVYAHAITLFDSAVAAASDSVRITHLAAVGRGRALLGRAQYAEAALAVAAVPSDYRYDVTYPTSTSRPFYIFSTDYTTMPATPAMADRQGVNGLDYRSSGDPRTIATMLGTDPLGNTMYLPAKYPLSGAVSLTMADGREARLIEAEAALHAGSGQWLTILNALRTDGSYTLQPNALDPTQNDTVWHAGAGGVAGLAPLEDPGSDPARIDLLFRERAFWLYLTAHRQGDLRRLVRDYRRSAASVYPTGAYPGGAGTYGQQIVAPVPQQEQERNPLYTGCFHRDA